MVRKWIAKRTPVIKAHDVFYVKTLDRAFVPVLAGYSLYEQKGKTLRRAGIVKAHYDAVCWCSGFNIKIITVRNFSDGERTNEI